MSDNKHVISALIELRSAVFDLSALVVSLAWGSSAVNIHDQRFAAVNTALAKAGKAIEEAQKGGE